MSQEKTTIEKTLEANAQPAEELVKKKPGPKPKTQKVEESKEAQEPKGAGVLASEVEADKKVEEPQVEEKDKVKPVKEETAEDTSKLDQKVKAEKSELPAAVFKPIKLAHRCSVYRTPSATMLPITSVSGTVFVNDEIINGFQAIKYNSYERGAKLGYIRSQADTTAVRR